MPFTRKLSPEQVEQIIARRATGESYTKIAPDFGVSVSRIYELCNPEKQAEKALKLKAKNAAKKAEKAALKGTPVVDAEIDEMNLDDDEPVEETEWQEVTEVDEDDIDDGMVIEDDEEVEVEEIQ